MATPRLPFLYPNFMRAVRSCEPRTYRSIRIPYRLNQRFHTSQQQERASYQRRYGPAVEPNTAHSLRPKKGPHDQEVPGDPSAGHDGVNASDQGQAPPDESQSEPPPQEAEQNNADVTSSETPTADQRNADQPTEAETKEDKEDKEDNPPTDREPREEQAKDIDGAEQEQASASSSPASEAPSEESTDTSSSTNQTPFEDVLHMPSPSVFLTPTGEPSSSDDRPPHLSAAPYVHPFDTYSLVQDLSKGGYSEEQSTTIMKAVRAILQNNLSLARASLTSKSDVENEEYLFKAACSELQSSLQTARNSEIQHQRSSRTQLQHETDIISQRLSQELSGMKDDIKGMFNDHKMSTREPQRTIDTSVQELNYKITVSLNSDGKSEIEGLRWILTRRAASTIAICAFMIIVFLKYASVHKAPEPKQAKQAEKPAASKEIATEARAVQDGGIQTVFPSAEAHLGESLG
ncbi:hypothetical protein DTO006G1_9654 [Penicillium roqueforti]|uniref:uncharacterized protein n=1 Tax=Penicillium roqueforti TaxID=5082 RepID=UPI00190D4682|nr:uncharacterized protein LCP9604111_7008 [Penicillium roqueforti]KAF9245150.1 hypothetical protein LCP9604111_7008 [Penicillium roqueforti]KAI1833245.1 hypothetical protein CBS147337_5743 [Penicillium roqueforti]KAI2671184.1 hypothetical protein CBS147355_8778 [Penicillium roqueforti]KAI2695719.1 hypothetical protein CBS147372_8982 [Penicillium roqueforti]KAI2709953.1 hypothetical protein CBS147318_8812 [Penicillium roqueforti]